MLPLAFAPFGPFVSFGEFFALFGSGVARGLPTTSFSRASTLGWRLTYVISGAPIVGVVLSLPDMGPLFLGSLLNQDMPLAGALIFLYCALTIIGTFLSDLLLVALDPRIRLE